MAVRQENKGKKKDFHDFFRMAEKQKAQADNSEFLTDESPNAAKHWGFCHRKGLEENHTNWRRLRSASAASSSLPYHMMPGNLR